MHFDRNQSLGYRPHYGETNAAFEIEMAPTRWAFGASDSSYSIGAVGVGELNTPDGICEAVASAP
jgi:hypothetical protein